MIGRASSGVSRNASPEPSSDVCPLEVVGVQRSRKAWRWVRTRVGCVWVARCLLARTVAGLRKMSTMKPSSVPSQSLLCLVVRFDVFLVCADSGNEDSVCGFEYPSIRRQSPYPQVRVFFQGVCISRARSIDRCVSALGFVSATRPAAACPRCT